MSNPKIQAILDWHSKKGVVVDGVKISTPEKLAELVDDLDSTDQLDLSHAIEEVESELEELHSDRNDLTYQIETLESALEQLTERLIQIMTDLASD
jgi:predicted nuclease with TOPRIM domain